MTKAKTPEEEVEPLADPEPDDAWPPVKEPHDEEDEPPDKKAAREIIEEIPPGPEPEPIPVPVPGAFDVSGPHHS